MKNILKKRKYNIVTINFPAKNMVLTRKFYFITVNVANSEVESNLSDSS